MIEINDCDDNEGCDKNEIDKITQGKTKPRDQKE
jgi:hypothetical protein